MDFRFGAENFESDFKSVALMPQLFYSILFQLLNGFCNSWPIFTFITNLYLYLYGVIIFIYFFYLIFLTNALIMSRRDVFIIVILHSDCFSVGSGSD